MVLINLKTRHESSHEEQVRLMSFKDLTTILHGWRKLIFTCSSTSCAVFRRGLRTAHVGCGGHLVAAGATLVTPASDHPCRVTWKPSTVCASGSGANMSQPLTWWTQWNLRLKHVGNVGFDTKWTPTLTQYGSADVVAFP